MLKNICVKLILNKGTNIRGHVREGKIYLHTMNIKIGADLNAWVNELCKNRFRAQTYEEGNEPSYS
jgi:hypothetical protein